MKSLWIVLAVVFTGVLAVPRVLDAQAPRTDITVTVTGHPEDVKGAASDHFMSFNVPVEVPGATLEPGTYVFRFVAPGIVQVLSHDRSDVYGMFQTTSITRTELSDHYVMTFRRINGQSAYRLTEWYLPDETTGYAPMFFDKL